VAEPSTVTDGSVHLSVPASTANLRVVRLVAASLATDLEFGVDEIEDVRVAVDELAALLLEATPGVADGSDGRRLELEMLAAEDGALEVRGSCPPPADAEGEPELHGVAAELLSLLVDDYEVGADADRWWFRLRRGHRVDDGAE
jgi:hypothetical protein